MNELPKIVFKVLVCEAIDSPGDMGTLLWLELHSLVHEMQYKFGGYMRHPLWDLWGT